MSTTRIYRSGRRLHTSCTAAETKAVDPDPTSAGTCRRRQCGGYAAPILERIRVQRPCGHKPEGNRVQRVQPQGRGGSNPPFRTRLRSTSSRVQPRRVSHRRSLSAVATRGWALARNVAKADDLSQTPLLALATQRQFRTGGRTDLAHRVAALTSRLCGPRRARTGRAAA